MYLSEFLSITAGIGYALAYVYYNIAVRKGDTKPNAATWAIWSLVALVSAGSYLDLSGDYWKSMIPLINIGLCVLTFVYTLAVGKFTRPDKLTEWTALGFGVLAAIVWKIFGSAEYATILVVVAIMFGFVPTWMAVWNTPSCEHPRPWWIWTLSYCVATIVIILRWDNRWVDLIYPASSILLHASVPFLSSLRTSQMVRRKALEQELVRVQQRIEELVETTKQQLISSNKVEVVDVVDWKTRQEFNCKILWSTSDRFHSLQQEEVRLKKKLGVA